MIETKLPFPVELKRLIIDLDDLEGKFRCGIDLVSAISDCCTYAPVATKSYLGAMSAACDHLNALQTQLENLSTRFFEAWKKYKESEE